MLVYGGWCVRVLLRHLHALSKQNSEPVGSLTVRWLSSRNQTDVNKWDEGTEVEEHHSFNLDHQRRKEGGGVFSVARLVFYHPHPSKVERVPSFFFSFFFQKTCQISDRQLFSSCMQIPLDSAKPSPRGENFKVGLSVKARGLKKACLCARRLKLSEWDAARGWMTLSAQFLWRLAAKVDVSLCLLKPTTMPKNQHFKGRF